MRLIIGRGEVVSTFRERLQQVIARSDLKPSNFARSLGIDRSTLSQLLAPTNVRLPRAETLAAIATQHGASVDWLLGLTSEERAGAEVVETVFLEGQADSPVDVRFLRWYAEAETAGYRIRSVPRSFPDFLKHEAVIAHEYGDRTETDVRVSVSWARERLERMRGSELNHESCMPLQALYSFARGEGQWHELDADVRRAQLLDIAAICLDLYPSLTFYLYDHRRTFSAPFSVFGPKRATVYVGSLFFMFTASEHVKALNRRFDDLIRAAVVQPPEAPTMFAKLADEVV